MRLTFLGILIFCSQIYFRRSSGGEHLRSHRSSHGKEVKRSMKLFKSMSLLIALCFLSVVCIAYADSDIPEDIKIDYKTKFEKSIKPAVEFTHKKHIEEHKVACADCHHVYTDGKNVWKQGDPVQKCEECHPTDRKEAKEKNVYDLRNAFHKNCQGCHKDLVKQGKKAPVKCNECHKES